MTPQYCFIVIIHIIKTQHYVIVYLQKLSYEGRDDCQQKWVRLHLWCTSFNSIGRPQKLILPDRRNSLKQCLVALNWSPIVMKYHPWELCHFSFSEKIPQPLLGQSFDSASGKRVCRKALIALWEKMILWNTVYRRFFLCIPSSLIFIYAHFPMKAYSWHKLIKSSAFVWSGESNLDGYIRWSLKLLGAGLPGKRCFV